MVKIPLSDKEKEDKSVFYKKIIKYHNGIYTNDTKFLKLVGPVSYYYYPDIKGRSILLLGDIHTPMNDECKKCRNDDGCMNINEYLTRIIRQELLPDKDKECIDFFVETQYRISNKQHEIRGGKSIKKIQENYKKYMEKLYSINRSGQIMKKNKGKFFIITGVICNEEKTKILTPNNNKCQDLKKINLENYIIDPQENYFNNDSLYNPDINTMSFVRENFDICIKNPKFCEIAYPYLRYHYFDIRQYKDIDLEYRKNFSISITNNTSNKIVFHPLLFEILDYKIRNILKLRLKKIYPKYTFIEIQELIFLFSIGEKTKDNIGEKLYDQIIKIIKELHKNKYITKYDIVSKKLIKNIGKKIQKQIDNIDNTTKLSRKKLIKFFINIYKKNKRMIKEDTGQLVFTYYADIYLLARIFRRYDKKSKKMRGAPGCKNKPISKNIIIFAGDFHIETYKKFFKEYFKIEPTVAIKSVNRKTGKYTKCVEIPHINPFGIPIFDKKPYY